MAAPASPPIRACDELVGSPKIPGDEVPEDGPQQPAEDHSVSTTSGCTTPLPMVMATWVPNT